MTNAIELRHPTWLAVVIWLGVFVIFGVAGFLLWASWLAIAQDLMLIAIFFASFAVWMTYIAANGVKLLPYVFSIIRLDDGGFQVISKHKTETYSWNQPLIIRNSAYLQILEVFDASNRRIVAVDHMIWNFDTFLERLERSQPNQSGTNFLAD